MGVYLYLMSVSFNIDNLILTFSIIKNWADLCISGQTQTHFSRVGNTCDAKLYTQSQADTRQERVVKQRVISCCSEAQSMLSPHLLIKGRCWPWLLTSILWWSSSFPPSLNKCSLGQSLTALCDLGLTECAPSCSLPCAESWELC